jgi:hypothetical protein
MEYLTAISLILGIGGCPSSTDYCPDPVGKFGVQAELVRYDRHSIFLDATHYSELGNGEPTGGDRGTELYTLNYRYTWSR